MGILSGSPVVIQAVPLRQLSNGRGQTLIY